MHSELLTWFRRGAGFAVGVAAVAGLLLLLVFAAPVLLLVFIAVLLASALDPIVDALRARLPVGRGWSIVLVYATFFVTVLALALIVVPAALEQGAQVVGSMPAFFDRAREWVATLRPAVLASTLAAVIDEAEAIVTPEPPDPEAVVRAGLTVAEAVAAVMTLLTIVYFWLVEHARLQRYLLAFLPAHRRAGARDAWNEVETRLGRWVRGQLVLMAAIGLATGIAYTLLGLPAALLLGLIAALAEAIPIVGPLIGAIPAILVAATISPQLALAVAVVYAVLQAIEGNVLVPLVMRNTIGLSPFVVLATVLVGVTAGGFVGALIAVPVAAAAMVLLERLQARERPVVQDAAALQLPGADAIAEHADGRTGA
jgi:predicted PurR-regulated permease PerM